MSDIESCAKCKFFKQDSKYTYTAGICRRYPPAVKDWHTSCFPEVGDVWCGEFKLSDNAIKEFHQNEVNKILDKDIEFLELTFRANNCLRSSNINTIGDLIKWNEFDLLAIQHLGKKSYIEISDRLELKGLKLGSFALDRHPDVKAYFDAKN